MITDPLLFRYLAGETNEEENSSIELWLRDDPFHSAQLEELRHLFDAAGAESYEGETLSRWVDIESGIRETLPPKKNRKTIRLVRIFSMAAMMLALFGSGLFWYLRYDARVIRNNQLATKSLFLSDGTQVYLGPASRLIICRHFNRDNREVRLTGEAFFDVQPDASNPFLVSAGQAKVRVTGTKFSVTASRKSEEVEVAVKMGQVLFYNSDIISKKAFRMGLGPGEMGIYSPSLNRMDKTRDPYYHSTP